MHCCNHNCNQGRDCPNRKPAMNTRRYPRTMKEAFGPYTRDDLEPMHDKRADYGTAWWLCMVLVCTASAVVIALTA